MKKTSQRSLLFRQNVNRTEAEWVHFLDGYRKALIEFDMKDCCGIVAGSDPIGGVRVVELIDSAVKGEE